MIFTWLYIPNCFRYSCTIFIFSYLPYLCIFQVVQMTGRVQIWLRQKKSPGSTNDLEKWLQSKSVDAVVEDHAHDKGHLPAYFLHVHALLLHVSFNCILWLGKFSKKGNYLFLYVEKEVCKVVLADLVKDGWSAKPGKESWLHVFLCIYLKIENSLHALFSHVCVIFLIPYRQHLRKISIQHRHRRRRPQRFRRRHSLQCRIFDCIHLLVSFVLHDL